MPRTTYQRMTVTDEAGNTHTFDAGDEVPDELAERVSNEAVWEKPAEEDETEGPLGNSSTEPEPGEYVVADPPWKRDDIPEMVTPAGGPVFEPEAVDTTSEPIDASQLSETGESPAEGDSVPSAEELDRMNRAELDETARRLGHDPSSLGTKAEVRSLIESGPAAGGETA